MTRFVSSTNEAEAEKPHIYAVLLVDLDFASGHLRTHTGLGTLSFGGNDYLGIGNLGAIDVISEDLDGVARPCRMALSGVDTTLISAAMTEVYQGRPGQIYLGFLQSDSAAFLDTPELVYEGKMDTLSIEVGETSVIRLVMESRLRREPRTARYTDEDQRLAVPGDKIFDWVPKILGYKSVWGDQKYSYRVPGVTPRATFGPFTFPGGLR